MTNVQRDIKRKLRVFVYAEEVIYLLNFEDMAFIAQISKNPHGHTLLVLRK